MPFRDLLLGCGARRHRILGAPRPWGELVTLDVNPDHKPDVLFNLEALGDHCRAALGERTWLPFENDDFDEIHAYEVLEHIGRQGDFRKFFTQFSEFWRVLKPGGLLCATVPDFRSEWAWGDPSHSRVITAGTLVFLSQRAYVEQVGKTPMSDFRNVYQADFDAVRIEYPDKSEQLHFELRAVKPSRYQP